MDNILIINAMKQFAHSNGRLSATLVQAAADYLREKGKQVRVTVVDEGYDIRDEIEKYLSMSVVIYQVPAWWMGMPWILKKYMDDVFTGGHGKLYHSDGRSRHDSAKKYGSGGLLQGKQYMISTTWNAPADAFTDSSQFFEGRGIDGVFFPFHKANQFIGLSPLPTFMCNDVMKVPDVDGSVRRYRQHLSGIFG
ncbi:MAG: NAD(P)H-dependent oxidoreductase [Burkholderiaceae bacterium]|jgi:modulator of drug activity B|nr:NAD(P)H-dependent oxidoreductase [Burkholderiaceae bacterium]